MTGSVESASLHRSVSTTAVTSGIVMDGLRNIGSHDNFSFALRATPKAFFWSFAGSDPRKGRGIMSSLAPVSYRSVLFQRATNENQDSTCGISLNSSRAIARQASATNWTSKRCGVAVHDSFSLRVFPRPGQAVVSRQV